MTVTEHVTRVAGVDLHWVDAGAGDGPPLLLLHGLGASSVKWLDTMPHLAATRRTIALDLPGFGRSDAPDASYTPAWLAGGVRAFMDAIDLDRAIVVGNSLGGTVATYLAAAWPHRCESVVLVSPALPNDGPPASAKVAAGFLALAVPGVGAVMTRRYWTRPPEVIVRESNARNLVDPARASASTVALLQEDAMRKAASPALLRAAYRAQKQIIWALTGRREMTWATLRALRVPTIFLWGERDQVLPVHIGHRAVGEVEGAHLIVLDDLGHNPQMEAPEEFARAVLSFVRAREVASEPGGQAG